MKGATFSIRCSRQQVGLMRRIFRFFHPATRPTYLTFGLEKAGKDFVWIPR
jgi:hypothetical protein